MDNNAPLIQNQMMPLQSGATGTMPAGYNGRGISDIVDTATGAIDTIGSMINDATSFINSAIDSLQAGLDIGSSPLSVLSSDVTNLVKTATDAVNGVIDSVDDTIGDLTSKASSLLKGPLEVKSQIEKIASSAMEAMATPVAFVTKAVDEVLESVSSIPELAGKATDWLSDIGSDALDKISSAVGVDITDTDALKEVIGSVTDTISKGFNSAKELYDSVSDTVGDVVSTAKEYTGALAASVSASYEAIVKDGGLIDSVMDNAQSIIDNVVEVLPDDMAEWVSEKSEKFLQKTSEKLKDKANNNIASVISKVTGVGIDKDAVGDIMKLLYSFGSSNSGLIAEDGTTLYNKVGDVQGSVIDKLYSTAYALCNNIKKPEYEDYDLNKDLYDVLLGLAAKLGLTDLINQLRECLRNNEMYFDSRTIKLLVSTLEDAAANGNPFTFKSILTTVAITNVPDLTDRLKQLGANLADDIGLADEFDDLMNETGIKIIELLAEEREKEFSSQRSSEEDTPVLSGNNVVLMCATSTNVVDRAIGSENRFLTQALMMQYAGR